MARPCPSRSIAPTRHIRGMSTLSADIILYQSCCTAASGGGVSTWTAASSCARGWAQPGLLGGRLPDASPPAASVEARFASTRPSRCPISSTTYTHACAMRAVSSFEDLRSLVKDRARRKGHANIFVLIASSEFGLQICYYNPQSNVCRTSRDMTHAETRSSGVHCMLCARIRKPWHQSS